MLIWFRLLVFFYWIFADDSCFIFFAFFLFIWYFVLFLALEDQSRITKELEEKRKQAEDAQLRLKLEREEAEKEHERMMERVRYEQEEKDKIVSQIY